MMSLLDSIIKHEGFRAKPYPDPLSGGEPYTFGHGLTYIKEEESIEIVKNRIAEIQSTLKTAIPYFSTLPEGAQDILVEMSFQMGTSGVLKFKNTLSLIERGEYELAAVEMLDSSWARQTPSRAKELSNRMASI